MEKLRLLEGAAPFYYPGNDVGCLLLHGFTGTPFEVKWLGQYLNQQGYTAYGPRLAGHGTTPEDMARVHWREWYADALAGYELLQSNCSRVFVLGLSMGGVLTLLLSSQEKVDGLVTMSAPHRFDDWRFSIAPLLAAFFRSLPKDGDAQEQARFHEHVIIEQQQRGEEPTGHPTYERWVVGALPQLLRMMSVMRDNLHRVSAPALLVHSRADRVVPYENVNHIYDEIGSKEKQIVTLGKSSHTVAEDIESQMVFDAATDFIAAHS